MTDDEQKVIAALQTLLGRAVDITASTSLRDGLGLDSNALVELTVLIAHDVPRRPWSKSRRAEDHPRNRG